MSSDRHLLRSVVAEPLSWCAVAVIVGVEWGFASWFRPPLPVLAIALGLGTVLLLAWPVFLLKSSAFVTRLYELPESLRRQEVSRLAQLEDELESAGAEQGLEQLRMLRQKMASLTDVIKRRLSAGEVTYGRYLGTAEQVYLSALDNLHDLSVAVTSKAAIDGGYIETRLRELGRGGQASAEQRREIETLEERRELLGRQERKIAELIASNEAAMTALDNTAAALAETRMAKGRASMDADAAMRELEELATRARKYSVTS